MRWRPGNVQAVRDFHKALETVVAGGMDGFAKVTTDDFAGLTLVSGPTFSVDAKHPIIISNLRVKDWHEAISV